MKSTCLMAGMLLLTSLSPSHGAGQDGSTARRRSPPVFHAVAHHDMAALKKLIANGADVNEPGDHGMTPLMRAAWTGEFGEVRVLLDHGADVNAKDWDGSNALLFAASLPDAEGPRIITTLIERGAKTNMTVSLYWPRNALEATMVWGPASLPPIERPHNLAALLRGGAPANFRYPNGSTILMEAVDLGFVESARVLLKYHADPSIRDNKGRTALDIARKAGNKELIRLLQPRTARAAHTKHRR